MTSEAIQALYKQAAHDIGDLFCWCVQNLKKFPPREGEWLDEVKRRLLLADAKAAEVDGTVNVVALNRIYDAWMRLSGFATCVSAQGEYRVQIEYRSLEKAQDAYSALIEIGKVLQESQERLLFGITPKETT